MEHTPTIRRYNIILYTREKRKRREKGKKKGKEIEDSVEKLNNQAVCSREGRFITINTFALMEDARPNINLNLVSKAKRKKKKNAFLSRLEFLCFPDLERGSGGRSMDPRYREREAALKRRVRFPAPRSLRRIRDQKLDLEIRSIVRSI